ncbi:MAG: hypothetical protein ACI9E4_001216, partial [Pseudohongiellaceae bacterium]
FECLQTEKRDRGAGLHQRFQNHTNRGFSIFALLLFIQ